MEVLFSLIFLPSVVVWLLFSQIGKGGFIDEALSSGLLAWKGSNQEDQD